MYPRPLTHDEKKAAEAAFRGLPADPGWSEAARLVYEGITKVTAGADAPFAHEPSPSHDLERGVPPEPVLRDRGTPDVGAAPEWSGIRPRPRHRERDEETDPNSATREQAIAAGALIDVTPQAQEVGLPVPVGLSRSLWLDGITGFERISGQEQEGRVRDLLLALRLHLSRSPIVAPVSQFPALLSFPPDPTPQVYPVCAVVQAELGDQPFLTLILPTELSTSFTQLS